MTNWTNLSPAKKIKLGLGALGSLILVLLIFQAGVWVGYRRASFAFRFGDNYYRAFGRPQNNFFGLNRDSMMSGHGAVGKVVRVALPTIVVAGPDNLEKVVLINDETSLRRFRDTIKNTDLKTDDWVIVLGDPNEQGQIVAKLIRVMPAGAGPGIMNWPGGNASTSRPSQTGN